MSVKKSGLIVPKFGALFTATEGASPLAVLDEFTKAAGPTTGSWNHWGHLSRENLPEPSSDGGDTTSYSTWLEMNTDSETEESVDSVTYSLAQLDAETIAAVSALNGKKVSMVELWFYGTKRFAGWCPSVKAAVSGRPAAGGTDQYAEMKLTLTILTPTINLVPLINVEGGIAPWPTPEAPNTLYIDDTAFVAAAA